MKKQCSEHMNILPVVFIINNEIDFYCLFPKLCFKQEVFGAIFVQP